MSLNIIPLRSYRATLIPPGADGKEVAALAARGALPTIRVKARDLFHAKLAAQHVTGREVHSAVEVRPPYFVFTSLGIAFTSDFAREAIIPLIRYPDGRMGLVRAAQVSV